MTEAPKILLAHHLKTLKLPTFLREYEKQARQCAAERLDHVQFLARLVELELIDRERATTASDWRRNGTLNQAYSSRQPVRETGTITPNVPKPVNRTSSPACSASAMAERTLSTCWSASAREISAASATALARFFLFMVLILPGDAQCGLRRSQLLRNRIGQLRVERKAQRIQRAVF
jgi:hypothetical protein